MTKARWPNLDIDQPYEIYTELEHVVTFLACSWRHRNGSVGTRTPGHQPKNVRIRAGKEKMLLDNAHAILLPRGSAGTPVQSRHYAYSLTKANRLSLNSLGEERSLNGARQVAPQPGKGRIQTYNCPDFVLTESPVLLEMYKSVAPQELDPHDDRTHIDLPHLNHPHELIGAIIVLLKLRWLVRLHSCAITLAGNRSSFTRFLKGVLADCTGAHQFPHFPLPYFDQVIENLKGHLGQSWPLFIGHVSLHNRYDRGTTDLPQLPGCSPVRNANSSVAAAEEMVDDIFVSWAASQPHASLPVESLMLELDYFQIRRPNIRVKYEGLYCWSLAKPQTKYRYTKLAQIHACHLTLALDLPPLWDSWTHSREEILEMARNVVAHHRTFSQCVRARVGATLTDEIIHMDSKGSLCPNFTVDCTKEQKLLFNSFLASPRDMGRLDPAYIGKCQESASAWLVGTKARFADTSSFHSRMAREQTPGGHTLPPLEGGTPRILGPKLSVEISQGYTANTAGV